MKKRWWVLLLPLFLVESLIVCSDLYSRRLEQGGILGSVYSTLDLILLSFFVVIVLITVSFLIDRRLRTIIENRLDFILTDQKWLIGVVVVLSLLIYESFQDFLFIRAEMPEILYQGYRQILINHISLLGWIFLVSFQILVVLIMIKKDLVVTWMKVISRKKWFYAIIIVAGIIAIFNQAAFGVLPQHIKSKWFEELNSPLIGLQVFFFVLVVTILLILLNHLENKVKWISIFNSDKVIIVVLILLAFVSWYSVPLRAGTFTDVPRPPNYAFYPRSDALGYEIRAYRLLAGNGTDRMNHVGFWHFLAVLHYFTGGGVQAGFILRLVVLSCIPALLYLITKSIGNRLSGLIVGILFIVRETNALVLVEYITIPQIKDVMTEPVTIFGIALTIALLLKWLDNSNKNTSLLLLAGGVYGWVILLRIEALVYIPAIGIGLLLLMWKSPKEWLRTMILFSIGLILMVGPWFFSTVKSTGSLLSIGMGKDTLLLNSFNEYTTRGEDIQESDDLNKGQLFPYNFANNMMQLFYYFPSNHQPMLTVKNLPGVFLNRIDYSDIEGDSFREKYLERYVRSLPYWWNDWDGHLVKRSIIPLFCSIFLIFLGFSQLEGRKKIIAVILVLMTIFHSGIFSFVGKSGGRFIQVVDWIPMVFYGIGISALLNAVLNKNRSIINDWWVIQHYEPDQNQIDQKRQRMGMVFSVLFLLMIGLSFPLAENFIPPRYTDEKLSKQLEEMSMQALNDPTLNAYLGLSDPDLEIVFGKALYPRFFKAGNSLQDNPKSRFTDFSIDRVEFFLVGTENIWAALPGSQAKEYFPHGSEVLILGSRAPQIKNIEGVVEDGADSGEYLKVSRIFIFDRNQKDEQPVVLDCAGPACEKP